MNREEAKEYAKNMSYRDAVYNALQGRCIPYRKATLIKLYELLDIIESQDVLDEVKADIEALPKTYPFAYHCGTYVKEDDVRKIIDKHKAKGNIYADSNELSGILCRDDVIDFYRK